MRVECLAPMALASWGVSGVSFSRAVEPSDGCKVIRRLKQSSVKQRGHHNAVPTWGNGQILGKSAGVSIMC